MRKPMTKQLQRALERQEISNSRRKLILIVLCLLSFVIFRGIINTVTYHEEPLVATIIAGVGSCLFGLLLGVALSIERFRLRRRIKEVATEYEIVTIVNKEAIRKHGHFDKEAMEIVETSTEDNINWTNHCIYYQSDVINEIELIIVKESDYALLNVQDRVPLVHLENIKGLFPLMDEPVNLDHTHKFIVKLRNKVDKFI